MFLLKHYLEMPTDAEQLADITKNMKTFLTLMTRVGRDMTNLSSNLELIGRS